MQRGSSQSRKAQSSKSTYLYLTRVRHLPLLQCLLAFVYYMTYGLFMLCSGAVAPATRGCEIPGTIKQLLIKVYTIQASPSLKSSSSLSSEGYWQVHALSSNPSCELCVEHGCSCHLGPLNTLLIAELIQVKSPRSVRIIPLRGWVDYSPPPLSPLFLSLFQGSGQPLVHHPRTRAHTARPRKEMNHL